MAKPTPPPQLVMVRPHLEGLAPIQLPPGYTLRTYTPKDRSRWNKMMDAAFAWKPGHANFDTLMAADPCYHPERVQLVVDQQDRIAATASAWIAPSFGSRTAMLHYVGADPQHQGQRLGYWVSLAALHFAAAEGRTAMALLTDDFRLPAIVTYLRMAFLPTPTHSTHPQRWRDILAQLEWPETFAPILNGPLLEKERAADLLSG